MKPFICAFVQSMASLLVLMAGCWERLLETSGNSMAVGFSFLCALFSLHPPHAFPFSDVTSDCDADADVFRSHHYTATPEESVQKVSGL